jgi:hypothetical protein
MRSANVMVGTGCPPYALIRAASGVGWAASAHADVWRQAIPSQAESACRSTGLVR